MLRFVILLAAAATCWTTTLGVGSHANAASENEPNVVFILADDLGYGDLGCYGHPVAKTPVLDRLASDGVRFTQHYSNGPECSPTRTAFLTGRYQQRVGGLECAIGTGNVGRYDDAIRLAEQNELGLPPAKTVLPSAMVLNGYRCGVFGKWHLGYEPKFNPMKYGWHKFAGYLGGNVHYFNHRETSDLHVLFRGRKPVEREGYMTHLITDDSIDFIERNRESSFFVYISHECPHFPYQGPADGSKEVTEENWMELDPTTYVRMLEDLDSEVGRVLAALDEAGVAEDTLVIFVSDNGGFDGAGNMGPLNGSKGTTLEGGIRVPLIMRWPRKIEAGQVCDQPCITFDLTRSILALAGAEKPAQNLEGIDIVSHVVEKRERVPRTLFWRGRRGEKTWTAVRDGDLKYVRKTVGSNLEEWMFDLEADLGEQNNLLDSRAGDAKRLKKLIADWEVEVRPER